MVSLPKKIKPVVRTVLGVVFVLLCVSGGVCNPSVFAQQQSTANPQSYVGGIKEVNQLFKDEELGSGLKNEEDMGGYVTYLILGISAALLVTAGMALWKKRKRSNSTEDR